MVRTRTLFIQHLFGLIYPFTATLSSA
jgi:hypothetical protein